ncbi:uncharacterized protein PFLUO_LOCUS7994 [Penicillium psychrofluorescens]|uniref:uncharacterized protein n=1 Tax=Penicillium psychrofluorescens TaxID=3158075 RepID=UPI003CCDF372
MFLSAALIKVPHGAWFTLMVAIALTCIFNLWRYGKEEQWTAEESDNVPLSKTTILQNRNLCLQDAFGGSTIAPVKGMGIFFDKAGSSVHTPTVFLHFLQKFSAAPEFSVFLHLRPLSIPSVAPNERYTVSRCFTGPGKQAIPNCFRLIVRHGYTDEIITADLGNMVFDLIRSYLQGQAGSDVASDEPEEMAALFHAWRTQIIYITGKEELKISSTANVFRRIILWVFLWMRDSSRTKIQHLNVESDRLVEIGFVKTM